MLDSMADLKTQWGIRAGYVTNSWRLRSGENHDYNKLKNALCYCPICTAAADSGGLGGPAALYRYHHDFRSTCLQGVIAPRRPPGGGACEVAGTAVSPDVRRRSVDRRMSSRCRQCSRSITHLSDCLSPTVAKATMACTVSTGGMLPPTPTSGCHTT